MSSFEWIPCLNLIPLCKLYLQTCNQKQQGERALGAPGLASYASYLRSGKGEEKITNYPYLDKLYFDNLMATKIGNFTVLLFEVSQHCYEFGFRNREHSCFKKQLKTLLKALRTQALTSFTSSFGLICR